MGGGRSSEVQTLLQLTAFELSEVNCGPLSSLQPLLHYKKNERM